MDKSRRIFSLHSLAASATVLLGKQAMADTSIAGYKLSGRAEAFVKRMGIKYPIVQAVIGGSTPELAAAVSNAGGLGGIGMSWSPEQEVRDYVKATRALTGAPFAIGYVLSFGANTLPAALDAGAPVIQFSFGTPSQKQVNMIRAAGAKFGMQVSTVGGAQQALDVGADYISLQGQEAGGHIQAQGSWRDHFPHVLAMAGKTPVLVAGGLSTGKDLREVLLMGASGGVFGTRFAATREYPSHPEYKRRMVSARPADTALTVCFDGGWPGALHRVLRNPTLEAWEAAGAQSVGMRPGEGDIVGTIGEMKFERYNLFPAFVVTKGKVEDMAMYAGTGIGAIRDIPAASEVVERLWTECLGMAV
jgi:NAD(P)H-dependent flavin oxidoreductase YrpB (nitropropane dioxygenase family)